MYKKSKLLLVSWVLTALYFIYIIIFLASSLTSTTGLEQASASLATFILVPHILSVGVALAFNFFAWQNSKKGFAITAAILYIVSIVFMPVYFMFVTIQTVLCFIGASLLES